MVFESIANYIAENFEIEKEDITNETTFEQLRAESEDVVDMLFEMSRLFDVIAQEDDLYGIEDVGGMVELVERLMEE